MFLAPPPIGGSTKNTFETYHHSFCGNARLRRSSNFRMVIVLLIPTYKYGFVAICDETCLTIPTTLLCTNPILSVAVYFCTNVRKSTANDFLCTSLASYIANPKITVIFWFLRNSITASDFRLRYVELNIVYCGC